HEMRKNSVRCPQAVAPASPSISGAVVFCWMFRQPLSNWLDVSGVSDAGIVMAAAVLLFMIPSGDSAAPRLMIWEDAVRLPWGVLILFGGGLSLAAAVSDSGLALWMGELLAPLNAMGTTVLVVAAVLLVIFLTELTSNLATTATLLPVVGAIAVQAGVPPIVLTVPITIAASCAFMLPVATPPNAIVFATGAISIPQMVKAGIVLNLIGVAIVFAARAASCATVPAVTANAMDEPLPLRAGADNRTIDLRSDTVTKPSSAKCAHRWPPPRLATMSMVKI
ncbi:MAG: anion permease, partial [Woeseiaceae bacterium]|nr:anion permease [Woeseiaceae bacterium]